MVINTAICSFIFSQILTFFPLPFGLTNVLLFTICIFDFGEKCWLKTFLEKVGNHRFLQYRKILFRHLKQYADADGGKVNSGSEGKGRQLSVNLPGRGCHYSLPMLCVVCMCRHKKEKQHTTDYKQGREICMSSSFTYIDTLTESGTFNIMWRRYAL